VELSLPVTKRMEEKLTPSALLSISKPLLLISVAVLQFSSTLSSISLPSKLVKVTGKAVLALP
jgi:hypothetical protein